jgi:hypothetical protein
VGDEAHSVILKSQNHHPNCHHLRMSVRAHFSVVEFGKIQIPVLSGDRNASAEFFGFASESGPLAGVIKPATCCSL